MQYLISLLNSFGSVQISASGALHRPTVMVVDEAVVVVAVVAVTVVVVAVAVVAVAVVV